MKKLLTICVLVMVFGVSLAHAQPYQYGVAPCGTKAFTTAADVVPGGTICLDIYLSFETPHCQNAGGVWIDASGSVADITVTSAGRCMDDGSEGCTGPWTAGAGANVPGAGGPGTHMLVVGGLGGECPDADGDLIVGTVSLQSTGPAALPATVNFTTIPSVATWTPVNDTDVGAGAIVITTVCAATTDADCDDGNFCNGVETWDGNCGCIEGTPPCDDQDPCTLDCDEDTDSCLPDTCDLSSINASTEPCCAYEPCASQCPGGDFTLRKESGFYQPPADPSDPDQRVTIKNKICLNNPDVLIGGIQFDLVDTPDCLTCIDCELTERTIMFDCAVLELPDGSCRVIIFCKNPGCAINPGECDIVTVVMQTNNNAECGDDCIDEDIINIVASDYDGFAIAGAGVSGRLCPVVCGDICPPGSGTANDCGDGVVDIYDIMCEVDFALTAATPHDCQLYRADVPTGTPPWCTAPDGSINILDVMVLIDSALNRQDCCSFYYQGIIY